MASTTSDTGDSSSKQQQGQRKQKKNNKNESKTPVSAVDHCHPVRKKRGAVTNATYVVVHLFQDLDHDHRDRSRL